MGAGRGAGRASRAAAAVSWAAAAATLMACGGGAPVDRPNIVLIIGDDQGYTDSGFMGNEIVLTPNLDRLAAEGTVFTTGYDTASACRPSLLTLLTGLQPYQFDQWRRERARRMAVRIDSHYIQDLETLPRLLARSGYRSFQAGKHWEGTARAAGFTAGTKDEHLEGTGVLRMSGGRKGLEIGRTTMQPVWDFLEEDSGEPFLLWFAPMLPHAPMNAPDEIRARYAGADLAPTALAYYANITWLDDAVGQLLGKLAELSLLDRTLVVYLSDNGWDNEPDVDYVRGRGRQLGGVRGKLSMRDLGFRTPLIFRWPGRVPSGRVRSELVSTLDLLPTLLAYAGMDPPPGREGIDLRPAIEEGASLPERTIYGFMRDAVSPEVGAAAPDWRDFQRAAFFARNARWHYIDYPDDSRRSRDAAQELYDVETDPTEEHDLSRDHPDIMRTLRSGIEAWRHRMDHALPSLGPNPRER